MQSTNLNRCWTSGREATRRLLPWLRITLIVLGVLCLTGRGDVQAAPPTITFDSASSQTSGASTTTSLSWSHTVGAGADRLLLVGVSIGVLSGSAPAVASVEFNGMAFSQATSRSESIVGVEIWTLPLGDSLSSTPGTITVTLASAAAIITGAASYFGVHQTTTVISSDTNSGSDTNPIVTLSSASGGLVVDTLAVVCVCSPPSTTADGAQTFRWSNGATIGPGGGSGAGSDKPGAPSVTMSWTIPSESLTGWVIAAVSLVPSTPTAVTLASFTASPETDGVRVSWQTASEVDTLGFNLWRSQGTEQNYVKLNQSLIPAQGGGTYRYADTTAVSGRVYFYRLEMVGLDSRSEWSDPVRVPLPGPSRLYLPWVGR